MLFLLVGVVGAAHLVNGALEEVIIPWITVKKAQQRGEMFTSRGYDVMLTEREMDSLERTGADKILRRGTHRYVEHALAHADCGCSRCGRLET